MCCQSFIMRKETNQEKETNEVFCCPCWFVLHTKTWEEAKIYLTENNWLLHVCYLNIKRLVENQLWLKGRIIMLHHIILLLDREKSSIFIKGESNQYDPQKSSESIGYWYGLKNIIWFCCYRRTVYVWNATLKIIQETIHLNPSPSFCSQIRSYCSPELHDLLTVVG